MADNQQAMGVTFSAVEGCEGKREKIRCKKAQGCHPGVSTSWQIREVCLTEKEGEVAEQQRPGDDCIQVQKLAADDMLWPMPANRRPKK